MVESYPQDTDSVSFLIRICTISRSAMPPKPGLASSIITEIFEDRTPRCLAQFLFCFPASSFYGSTVMAMIPRRLNQMITIRFDREFCLSSPAFITPLAPPSKFLGVSSLNTIPPQTIRTRSSESNSPMGIGILGRWDFA